MATKTMSKETIERATGRSWAEWLEFFEKIGAKDLDHKAIARLVYEELSQTDMKSPGWWSQGVTVTYEQHIGRRQPGQAKDKYQVAVSRTMPGTMDEAFDAWLELIKGINELSGNQVTRGPSTSKTEKWRYWHCGLSDGSKVTVSVYQKSSDKAALALGQENMADEEMIEKQRKYWKKFLKKL